MPRIIKLQDIILLHEKELSKKRKSFLLECKLKLGESTTILAEPNPNFDYRNNKNLNQWEVFLYADPNYDVEVRAGEGCYITDVTAKKAGCLIEKIEKQLRYEVKFQGRSFSIKYSKETSMQDGYITTMILTPKDNPSTS